MIPVAPFLPRRQLVAALLSLCAALHPAGAASDPKAARFYEDALLRFEKKDMPGAIIQLKNALKIDNTMLPVQVLLGKALLANSEVVAAEVAFNESLRLGVNRAEVVLPLAKAVAAQANAKALLDDPRFVDTGLPVGVKAQLSLLKASAAADLGNTAAALKFVQEARAIDPSRPDSWLAELPVRLRAHQLKEATAVADKALSLAPDSADATYLRGSVAHVQADRTTALSYYDKALKLSPSHADTLIARAGLLVDMGRFADAARDIAELKKSSPSDPRGAYLAALMAERDGDVTASRAALNEVTALLDPVPLEFMRYRPQLLMLGGLSHYGLGQREKAKPYLEAVQRSQPGGGASKLLAQIYLSEKNVDRAIESLDAYLKGNPGDAQALHLLASAHMSQGRHARAAAIMQDALRRSDLPAFRGMLGLSMIKAGKYEGAIAELENAFKRDPGQVQAGSALVSIYMQSGQTANAVRVAEGLVKFQPKAPGLHNLLGTARVRAGNLPAARAAFEQSLKLDPEFAAAQINLARLDVAAGAVDAGLVKLNAVLAKDDKNVDALSEAGRIAARRGQLEDAQRWFEKAEDHSGLENLQPGINLVEFHLGNRRPDLAREAIKRLTGKAPEAVPVLMTVAKVNLASGDPAAARTVLTRAANLANYDSSALVQIAFLQVKADHLPGAAYSLDKALKERPDLLPAHLLMTDVEIRQGELAKAEQRARKIAADHPKLGAGYTLLGDVAAARSQRAQAIENYRRAHALEQSSTSLLRLFQILNVNDPAAALQLAEQWVKGHPRDLTARRAIAASQARKGNLVAARSSYEALLKLAPNDIETLNNLANVLLLQNDPGALKLAEQALSITPGVPHLMGTAGWAAFKAGQPDKALQLLRDARLRDPNNADTRYFLGAVLASAGRKTEAREEIDVALRSGMSFDNKKNAEQLLLTLK